MASLLLQNLAQQFVERCERFSLKGKKADEFAVEFFAGAYASLHNVGHPEATHIGNVTMMLICTRGYNEVKTLAKGPVPPPVKKNKVELQD